MIEPASATGDSTYAPPLSRLVIVIPMSYTVPASASAGIPNVIDEKSVLRPFGATYVAETEPATDSSVTSAPVRVSTSVSSSGYVTVRTAP